MFNATCLIKTDIDTVNKSASFPVVVHREVLPSKS